MPTTDYGSAINVHIYRSVVPGRARAATSQVGRRHMRTRLKVKISELKISLIQFVCQC